MNAYRSPAGPELPFHEYVRQSLAGSSKDVELFPGADRIGKLRFQIGGEGPLVLVDDTVMRSCKAGVLLTTHGDDVVAVAFDTRIVDAEKEQTFLIRG